MTDQITEQTKEMIEMVQIFLKEIEEKGGVKEDISFKLPPELRAS